jgi:hypothetical protein
MTQERAIIDAKFVHHLGYTGDIVIAAADETNEGFPCILFEYAYASKFRRFLCEVGIGRRPLIIQLGQVRSEVEIVLDKLQRAVVC